MLNPLVDTAPHAKASVLDRAIPLHVTQRSVQEVLDEIARTAGLNLTYAMGQLARTAPVTVQSTGIRVRDAFTQVLSGTELRVVSVRGNDVVLGHRNGRSSPVPEGTVTGTVSDETRRPLAGATVSVNGRTAHTDQNGQYRIPALREGNHPVVVRYIGYLPDSSTVAVHAPEFTVHDVQLRLRPASLQTLLVTGQRLGQSLALSQQQSAPTITNIVAAEEIQQLPDRNVAEALQRFPGVSVENNHGAGQNVVIRGLTAQYNNVTFSGVSLPSSAGGDRAVPLDMFASEMLGSIEVSKTLTPDMDANAIGGTINLVPRAPIGGPATVQLLSSVGESRQTRGTITQYAGLYGARFGRNQRFGVLLGGSYYDGSRGSDDIDVSWAAKTIAGQQHTVLDDLQFRDYDFAETRIGGVVSADYRIAPGSTLYLRGMTGTYDDNSTRRSSRVRFSAGTYIRPDSLTNGRIDRGLVDNPNRSTNGLLDLGGEHRLGQTVIDYDVSYARAGRRQVQRTMNVGRRRLTLHVDATDPNAPAYELSSGNSDDLASYTFNNFTVVDARVADRNLTGAVNARTVRTFNDVPVHLQFGGKVQDKHKNRALVSRNFDGYQGTLTLADFAEPADDAGFFQDQYRIGRVPGSKEVAAFFDANAAKFNQNATDSEIDSKAAAYDANEQVTAAYLMATVGLGKLTIIPGIRLEHTNLDYVGNEIRYDTTGVFAGTAPVAGGGRYTNIMPGLNGRLLITESTNMRFALTRSISRPLYGDIAPSRTVEPQTSQISLGNPELKPTLSINGDLLAERYSASIGVLSAGLFYKGMTDFVFTRDFQYPDGPFAGYQASQPQNGAKAYVYGVEVNWQQQLAFLPGLLSGLGVSTNYTFTDSKAEIPGRERNAQLPGQARHVGNFILLYDKHGFAGRVATSLYGKNLTGVGATSATDVFFNDHLEMDVSASYRTRYNIQLYGELANLINGPRRRFQGTTATPVEHEYYAPWMQFGVRVAR